MNGMNSYKCVNETSKISLVSNIGSKWGDLGDFHQTGKGEFQGTIIFTQAEPNNSITKLEAIIDMGKQSRAELPVRRKEGGQYEWSTNNIIISGLPLGVHQLYFTLFVSGATQGQDIGGYKVINIQPWNPEPEPSHMDLILILIFVPLGIILIAGLSSYFYKKKLKKTEVERITMKEKGKWR